MDLEEVDAEMEVCPECAPMIKLMQMQLKEVRESKGRDQLPTIPTLF